MYSQVEVCVNKSDTAALWMYKKAEFEDTGYIDETVPKCCSLMYNFNKDDHTTGGTENGGI